MELVKVSEIVKQVREVLEHNEDASALRAIEDIKTLSVDSLIQANLELAAAYAVQAAGNDMIDVADVMDAKAVDGRVEIPVGMLKFLSVIADGWDTPVLELADAGTPMAMMAKDRYVHNVGVKDNPVAVLVRRGAKQYVELYPDGDTAQVSYVAEPKVTEVAGEDMIPCDALLRLAVVYRCAYLVAMEQGWANMAYYKSEADRILGTPAAPAALAQTAAEQAEAQQAG